MHLAQNRYFDQFAIDNHETGVSLRETLQDLFGMGDRGFIGRENGIVTLTKNGPNLLVDHEAKPLKLSISTIGESPRFRCESD